MPERRILVIDSDADLRAKCTRVFKEEGFQVQDAADSTRARELVAKLDFDYLLCELEMQDRGGHELIPDLVAEQPQATLILLTAGGAIDDIPDSVKVGAYDALPRSFEPGALLGLIRRAEERLRLRAENRRLRTALQDERGAKALAATSDAMKRVLDLVDRAARFETPVLVTGERGVGKEVVAQTVHEWSDRSEMPFIAVRCGVIAKGLLESELFGHARGMTGGSGMPCRGLVREADGGTLFFDEIGDLPASAQEKLLRLLQEGEVRALGADQPIPVDVRILAATERDLEAEARAGRFRRDLLYRLDVARIEIPPLRERLEDLPDLAEQFLRRLSRRLGKKRFSLDAADLERLGEYSWPGNVRELENVLERRVMLGLGNSLELDALQADARVGSASSRAALGEADSIASELGTDERSIKRATRQLEERLIRQALAETGGNRTQAARILEISPRTLYYKLKELDLVPSEHLNRHSR